MSDTLSPDAGALLDVVRTLEGPPYDDAVRVKAGTAPHLFKLAVDELVNSGHLKPYVAPGGTLLYPTVRGFQLMRERQTPLLPTDPPA